MICDLLLILQSLPPPSHSRDGSACPESRTSTSGHLSGSTCPTPPSWEYPGRGGHRSRSPFSSGDRATLHPTAPPPKTRLSIKKKKNLVERELCEEHFRFGDMACTPMHSLPPRVAAAPRRAHHRSPRLVATRRCSVGHRAETCASASQSPACPCKMSACSSWSASYFLP